MRNGVEAISNPGAPLLEGGEHLLSELWAVQEANWMDASRVHAQRDLITVVDPPANQVHLISTSGEVQASLGRPGDGPGEFRRLLDAFPNGHELVVLDGGKSNIQYLDFDGQYLSSLHVIGQTWDGFLLGTGELLLKGEFLSDPRQESFGDWVTVGEGRDPVAFTSLRLDPLPEEQGVRCSDFSSWAGGAARMRFTIPQIQVFDPTGVLRKMIEVNLPIEVVSDSERDSALSELRRTLAARGLPPEFIEQNLVVMEERWRVKCRFGPLRFDPSGRFAAFLEQNPDDFGSGRATLHVLTKDGVYLAKLAFPEAWRDFTIDDGVVYALTRDSETDLITLRAYRVDLPEAVFRRAAEAMEEARRSGDRLR
ncbi:6-bladed beta-propeller [Gemmatimonadota bacterium]